MMVTRSVLSGVEIVVVLVLNKLAIVVDAMAVGVVVDGEETKTPA
jgi:hypothetical protein